MIFSENAPELETLLHKHFEKQSVNRVNLRKEFFHVSLDEIVFASSCKETIKEFASYIWDEKALERGEDKEFIVGIQSSDGYVRY